VNCNNIKVKNQEISNTNVGIQLWDSFSCVISNNIFSSNNYGIYLNGYNNVVRENTISDNHYGLWIHLASLHNMIYHNNIKESTSNAIDNGYNYWDNSYLSGGNYWDDYTGVDSDGDGIGDTPYIIPEGHNQDNYPFMEPNGWKNNLLTGPYPQNPDYNSIFIVWETNSSTKDNSVHFGLTPALGNIVYDNETDYFHEIKLNGLSPSTKYYYKVKSENFESKIYCFFTAFEENTPIRFISYGDTRGVWDNWVNAKIVADSIEKEDPFFVIHSGDLVNNGKIAGEWIDYFKTSGFIHNSTLYPALGNHERNGDSYFKYFNLPNNEYWYSFNYGPVHFICLDSNLINSVRMSQMLWLIKNLRSNNKLFTVVFFHHPPYSSGNHGSTFYLRLIWGFVFEHFNVDIVFNGHDHSYERGKVGSVNYIVTGGGGAPLYDIGNSWWTIYSEKTYHYCLVSANQNELTFEAKKPDGTIIDSFVITK
jgi:parallel beta-helix repeat protein